MSRTASVTRILCLLALLVAWPEFRSVVRAGELYGGYYAFGGDCCAFEGTLTNCNADPEAQWNSYSSFACLGQGQCFMFLTWAAVHCAAVQTDSCGPVDCPDDCYDAECDEELPCCSVGAGCVDGYCEG